MSRRSSRIEEVMLIAGGSVVIAGVLTGFALCSRSVSKVRRGDGSATKLDSTLYSINDAFSTIGGAANPNSIVFEDVTPSKKDSIRKNYVFTGRYYAPTSSELEKMADSTRNPDKLIVKPVTYGGIEVDSMKYFLNAKLLGVDNHAITYHYTGGITSYFVKGLLFELNGDTLVNLVSRDNPFYVGQRYNLSYHPFKSGVAIDGEAVIRMLENKNIMVKTDKTDNNRYDRMYDGILVNSQLKMRNDQVKQ